MATRTVLHTSGKQPRHKKEHWHVASQLTTRFVSLAGAWRVAQYYSQYKFPAAPHLAWAHMHAGRRGHTSQRGDGHHRPRSGTAQPRSPCFAVSRDLSDS